MRDVMRKNPLLLGLVAAAMFAIPSLAMAQINISYTRYAPTIYSRLPSVNVYNYANPMQYQQQYQQQYQTQNYGYDNSMYASSQSQSQYGSNGYSSSGCGYYAPCPTTMNYQQPVYSSPTYYSMPTYSSNNMTYGNSYQYSPAQMWSQNSYTGQWY